MNRGVTQYTVADRVAKIGQSDVLNDKHAIAT